MSEIRIQKIDGQEFVPYNDYKELKERYENLIRANKKASEHIDELEEENQKLKEERDNRKDEYKKVIDRENERVYNCNEYYAETMETRRKNMELKEENKKLKYVIDLVMEKAGIEYIRLADGDVFVNPKNKLHISDTIQVDILNGKQ